MWQHVTCLYVRRTLYRVRLAVTGSMACVCMCVVRCTVLRYIDFGDVAALTECLKL